MSSSAFTYLSKQYLVVLKTLALRREARSIYRLLGNIPKVINIYARLLRMSISRNFTANIRTLHRCQRLLLQRCRVSWEDGPLCLVVTVVNFKLPTFVCTRKVATKMDPRNTTWSYMCYAHEIYNNSTTPVMYFFFSRIWIWGNVFIKRRVQFCDVPSEYHLPISLMRWRINPFDRVFQVIMGDMPLYIELIHSGTIDTCSKRVLQLRPTSKLQSYSAKFQRSDIHIRIFHDGSSQRWTW